MLDEIEKDEKLKSKAIFAQRVIYSPVILAVDEKNRELSQWKDERRKWIEKQQYLDYCKFKEEMYQRVLDRPLMMEEISVAQNINMNNSNPSQAYRPDIEQVSPFFFCL